MQHTVHSISDVSLRELMNRQPENRIIRAKKITCPEAVSNVSFVFNEQIQYAYTMKSLCFGRRLDISLK